MRYCFSAPFLMAGAGKWTVQRISDAGYLDDRPIVARHVSSPSLAVAYFVSATTALRAFWADADWPRNAEDVKRPGFAGGSNS